MIRPDFDREIERLRNTFGKTPFSNDRLALAWNEVKDLSAPWFNRWVDFWLSNERQAPLPKDFREATSVERERLYESDKQKQKLDVEDYQSMLSDDQTSMLLKTIVKRMNGQVPDDQWKHVVSGCELIANGQVVKGKVCTKCDNTTIETYFDGKYENRRLCTCV